jgi:hypothetical protein
VRLLFVLVVCLVLGACGDLSAGAGGASSSPSGPSCAGALDRSVFGGSKATVVASYELTAAEGAAWEESDGHPGGHAGQGMAPLRAYPPNALVTLCYFDGELLFNGSLPYGAAKPSPTQGRALLVVGPDGRVPEQIGGTPSTLPAVRPTSTPGPSVSLHDRSPVAIDAAWRTTPITSTEIVALLNSAGIPSRLLPPAPARLLLFGASDLDLVGMDDSAIAGSVIYRFSDIASAKAGLHNAAAPGGTVDWVAKPYFVLIGDALVNFATDDTGAATRIIAALQTPPHH